MADASSLSHYFFFLAGFFAAFFVAMSAPPPFDFKMVMYVSYSRVCDGSKIFATPQVRSGERIATLVRYFTPSADSGCQSLSGASP